MLRIFYLRHITYQFNASTSHIDINADATLAMGTGDFTIEWFQYQTDSNNWPRIFAIGAFPNQSIGCSIEGGTFYAWCTGANSFGSVTPYKNTWVHFAMVRRSGMLYVFKNGVSIGTPVANTTDITNASNTLWIGEDVAQGSATAFGGYITNFRWTKGLAVYTGNFTVPTGALTLTAAANPFGGSNTVAIPNGNVKILLVP